MSKPEINIVRIHVTANGEVILDEPEIKHVKVPEGALVQTTVYFKLKGGPVKGLRNKKGNAKGGITIRTTEFTLGDFGEDEEEVHEVKFPEESAPSGFLLRGQYSSTSSYYVGDELIKEHNYITEIVKK